MAIESECFCQQCDQTQAEIRQVLLPLWDRFQEKNLNPVVFATALVIVGFGFCGSIMRAIGASADEREAVKNTLFYQGQQALAQGESAYSKIAYQEQMAETAADELDAVEIIHPFPFL